MTAQSTGGTPEMDIYTIRRQILQAIKDAEVAGANPVFSDVAEFPFFARLRPLPGQPTAAELVGRELPGLIKHGYVKCIPSGQFEVYHLTAEGMDQIDRETALDEFVWGDQAAKFRG